MTEEEKKIPSVLDYMHDQPRALRDTFQRRDEFLICSMSRFQSESIFSEAAPAIMPPLLPHIISNTLQASMLRAATRLCSVTMKSPTGQGH